MRPPPRPDRVSVWKKAEQEEEELERERKIALSQHLEEEAAAAATKWDVLRPQNSEGCIYVHTVLEYYPNIYIGPAGERARQTGGRTPRLLSFGRETESIHQMMHVVFPPSFLPVPTTTPAHSLLATNHYYHQYILLLTTIMPSVMVHFPWYECYYISERWNMEHWNITAFLPDVLFCILHRDTILLQPFLCEQVKRKRGKGPDQQ